MFPYTFKYFLKYFGIIKAINTGFQSPASSSNVRMMEDKKKGLVVRGLKEEIVMNAKQVVHLRDSVWRLCQFPP